MIEEALQQNSVTNSPIFLRKMAGSWLGIRQLPHREGREAKLNRPSCLPLVFSKLFRGLFNG